MLMMQERKECYIVGAGDFDVSFKRKCGDLVIAADGGYDHLVRHGLDCDILIGDLDSVTQIPDSVEKIVFPVEKDFTDTALALYEGERRGYRSFTLLGGTGGRSDHTYANYCLLLEARMRGLRAKMVSKNCTALVIKDEKIRINCTRGCHFSAFAFGGAAEDVSISGFYYEAEIPRLAPSCHTTASNIFTEKTGEIGVRSGALLIIAESENAKIEFCDGDKF